MGELVTVPVHRSQKSGFTLIELMITVVVVVILATLTYPSFMNQIRKSRRSDAIQALAALQQAQERWRSQNLAYAGNGVIATAWPTGLGLIVRTAGGYYDIAIATNPAPTGWSYAASATAVTGTSQASDTIGTTNCATLTVTVTNGNATYTPAACWSR
ncbi:type IV pilin protein [Malikia sp.]|uniref:type IV pilin protein n=1 Tax=Malikia sp. TaxID=2070706 RepID=UPI00260EF63C|nr:type IV pilin protein [Malikia sp.]MDD2730316.1 type IV pilin protein [Malikia sp.]